MTISPNRRMVEILRTPVLLGALLLLASFFSFAQSAEAATPPAEQRLAFSNAEQIESASMPVLGAPANGTSAYSEMLAFLENGDRSLDDRDENPDAASAGSPGVDCLRLDHYLLPPAPAGNGIHFRISDPLCLLSGALVKIGARAPPSA